MAMEIVEYQGAKVRVKPRKDGRTVLYWREARKPRATTFKRRADAMKEATRIAKRLSKGQGGRHVTVDEAEIVNKVQRLAGERSPFLWLSEVEAAQHVLGSHATLAQAVNHYKASGMLSLERVSFTAARQRFMTRYDKSGKYTRGSMRRTLMAFERSHPDFGLLDFTPDLLKAWIEKGAAAETTFNAQLGYWKTFLGSCREWKYLPKGEKTAAELIAKKRTPDGIPPIFTVPQSQAIVDALPMELLPAFVIGNWMGPRPLAEMRNMSWPKFDWSRGYYDMDEKQAGKTMRARFIPIPDNVRAMLAPWRDAKGKCVRYTDQRKLAEFVTALKMPKGIGDVSEWPVDVMRHSSISYMLADGISISVVAERHGNSETIIRKKYRRPLVKEDALAFYAVLRSGKAS